MLDPHGLLNIQPGLAGLDRPVLVSALEGFVDAASAVRLLREHLLGTGNPVLVAQFDADQLVDYRARRPLLKFDRDHWASMSLPSIDVHALRDAEGQTYLLLTGPEPDVQWQRFAGAVEILVHALQVRLVIGLDAVPLAVPHTRPLGITAHSSRPELVANHHPWFDEALVPGSAGHALEFLLGERSIDTAGFAVHVPQYLAQSEYPQAALRLAEALGDFPGLRLDVTTLEQAAGLVAGKVHAEATDSPEISEMIAGLEQQYDAFMAARASSDLLPGGKLPSADELAGELERFLADQARREHPES